MDQRTPHINRLRVSDAIVESCRAYSRKDTDLAFRWAIEVLRRAHPDLYLNPDESSYIQTVIKKMDGFPN
jgi:hypothetical protein